MIIGYLIQGKNNLRFKKNVGVKYRLHEYFGQVDIYKKNQNWFLPLYFNWMIKKVSLHCLCRSKTTFQVSSVQANIFLIQNYVFKNLHSFCWPLKALKKLYSINTEIKIEFQGWRKHANEWMKAGHLSIFISICNWNVTAHSKIK